MNLQMTIPPYMSSGNRCCVVTTAARRKIAPMNLTTLGFVTIGTKSDSPESYGNLRLARGTCPWDVYFLYNTEATWDDAPTAPDFWMRRMTEGKVPRFLVKIREIMGR